MAVGSDYSGGSGWETQGFVGTAEAGRLRASLGRQRQGEGMKSVKVKHPLPSSYRTSRGSRRVRLHQFSLFLANLALLAFLQFKVFSLNINNIKKINLIIIKFTL